MMKMINMHEAKSQLSRLVDAAANGEEIIISRAGKPIARLGPFTRPRPSRRFGVLKDEIRISDDFDEPLPDDVIAGFEGR
jgi:prevent-host-death family protein